MSFFNQMLASIGIGSAKVDTRLASNKLRVGDKLEGVIHIQGGSAEQKIDSIYLHLMTQYRKEQGDSTVTVNAVLQKWNISSPLTIGSGESREVPFSFTIPLNTPVTIGRTPVWLKTGLDIDSAVDPGDNDQIQVLPHPSVEAVLKAVTDLGFKLKNTTTEYSKRLGRGVPFVQEFEFYPSPSFRGSIKELELVFFVESGGVEVLVEVDRRARGFTGFLEQALEMDERKALVRLSSGDLARGQQYIAQQLTSVIEHHTR